MCYMWIAQAGIAAAAAYQQSRAQKAQAQYQSQVAANNAKVAEMQADDAEARGNTAAQEMRRKYAALQGSQRATLAARGLDISDGSANAVLTDTSIFGAIDEDTVHANAAREAWGYRVRAANAQGDAAFYSATAAATNPLLSAGLAAGASYLQYGYKPSPPSKDDDPFGLSGGTLFSGAGSVADKWYRHGGGNSPPQYGYDGITRWGW